MDIDRLSKSFFDMIKDLNSKYKDFSIYSNRKELINLEMFFIYLYIIKMRPEVVFESGFWNGRSSLIILETLKRSNINCDYYVACVKKDPNVYFNYDNFNLIMNRGEEAINKVAILNSSKKMISLVDGPKFKYYEKCAKIYDSIFSNFDVQAIFQHDIHRSKDMVNYKKYYDVKVVKDKYMLYQIEDIFLNKYANLLETEKIEEQKIGVICDKKLFIKDYL